MSKGLHTMLAAVAAVSVLPAGSYAASVVLSLVNVQTSASPTFAAGTVTIHTPGVGSAPTFLSLFSMPAGGLYLRYSVRAAVTNNTNAAVASGYLIDSDDDGIGDTPQPATLGIGAFGAYVTSNSPASPVGSNGGPATAAVNALFASVSSSGTIVGTNVGDVASPASFIAGGTNSGAVNASQTGNLTRLSIGANTVLASNNLYATLQFFIPAYTNVVDIRTFVPTTSFAFVANNSLGDATTAPTYTNRNFNPAIDTLIGPGRILTFPEPSVLTVLGTAAFGLTARRRRIR